MADQGSKTNLALEGGIEEQVKEGPVCVGLPNASWSPARANIAETESLPPALGDPEPWAGSCPVPSSSSRDVPVPLIQPQTPDGPLQAPCVPDVGVLAHTSEEKG